MNELIEKVIQWSNDRNIIKGSTPIKQHDKLVEEVLETRDAIIRASLSVTPEQVFDGDENPYMGEIKDGLGDSLVCLINLATMYGFTLEECLEAAYEEIKDRKGKMINGTFVKEQ